MGKRCSGMDGSVHYKINATGLIEDPLQRRVMSEERVKRKKWGNKPGKFIFPRGLPFKFRPSKNGPERKSLTQ